MTSTTTIITINSNKNRTIINITQPDCYYRSARGGVLLPMRCHRKHKTPQTRTECHTSPRMAQNVQKTQESHIKAQVIVSP